MSADPIDISSILTDQGSILASETLAAMLLWSAQTTFARETGKKDQIGFVDLAMRLYVAALVRIDRVSAVDYLAALTSLHDDTEHTAEARQVAAIVSTASLRTLREKLVITEQLAGGQC